MKIIAHNKGDLVRWRLVSMEVNHYERHDVFAGIPALKVFRMLIAKAASHNHPEHGHRKVIAILDLAFSLSRRHGRHNIRTSTSRSRARSNCRVVF